MKLAFSNEAYVSDADACVIRRGWFPRCWRFLTFRDRPPTSKKMMGYHNASPWHREANCLGMESRGSGGGGNARKATSPRLTLGRYAILVEAWEPWE